MHTYKKSVAEEEYIREFIDRERAMVEIPYEAGMEKHFQVRPERQR
jgi:hypothetical protein